jgi:acyl-CoA thioesterase
MPHSFDEALALQQRDENHFQGQTDTRYWNRRGPFGGYAAALLLKAMMQRIGTTQPPRSLTADFVSAMVPGAFTIAVTVERQGKSIASLSARIIQGDIVCAVSQATFYRERSSPTIINTRMPTFPVAAQVPVWHNSVAELPFLDRFEYRVARGFPGSGGDDAQTGGWLRATEPRVLDPLMLVAYADAWYPALWSQLTAPANYTTISFTVYFRQALPLASIATDGYVAIINHAQYLHEGFVDSQGELWSAGGILLAQMSQIGPMSIVAG